MSTEAHLPEDRTHLTFGWWKQIKPVPPICSGCKKPVATWKLCTANSWSDWCGPCRYEIAAPQLIDGGRDEG